MIFKLPFRLPPSEGTEVGERVLQPMPVFHVRVERTKDWQDDTQNIDQAAEALLEHYAGTIRQFYMSQSQNRSAGAAQNANTVASYPQMEMRDQNLQGQERLEITLRPQSSSGAGQQSTGDVLDIDIPFNGWPLLGWDYYEAGGLPNGAGGWTIGTRFGSYFFDPGFVSSNDDAPTPVLVAQGSTYQTIENAGYPFSTYEWGFNDGFFNIEYDISPFTSGGLVEQWWQVDIGGSGIAIQPLAGQQYFEVEIITLPTAVPPDIQVSYPNLDDGTFYRDDCLYIDQSKFKSSWPADLNTFWNPCIGVIPERMLNKNWKANTVAYGPVVGLDDFTDTPRSIYLTRTSKKTGSATVKLGNPGYYYVDAGGTQIICYDNAFNSGDGASIPNPPVIEWGANQLGGVAGQFVTAMHIDTISTPSLETPYSAAGLTVAQCIKAIATAIADGFSVTFSDHGSNAGVEVGSTGNSFNITAEVGQPYTITSGPHAGTYTMNYHTGTTTTTSYDMPLGDVLLSIDQRTTGGIMSIIPTSDYNNYFQGDTIPLLSGVLNFDGVHAPIFKGRADVLYNLNPTGPTDDLPVTQTSMSGYLANGFWTGIDLGNIQEKDVIMVAVDTASRGVWFGKNGKWWGQSGESPFSPGSPDLPPAALLDGDAKTNYYPAASFRSGPTHMRMLFGTAQHYTPPGGFKAYGGLTFPTAT